MEKFCKDKNPQRQMKTVNKSHWPIGILFILIVALADQLTKWWAYEKILEAGDGVSFLKWLAHAPEYHLSQIHNYEPIFPFMNFVMVWNTGISFGLFNSSESLTFTIITIVTIAIILTFLVWMVKAESKALALGLSMVIGGAIGNLFDRFRFGAVADFLDFHIAGFHWPAFNLADTCIVLGIAFALFDSLFLEPHRRSKNEHESKQPQT
jgi:signal peptidase II